MADGTISIAEGLGIKALDSNEVRRKQMNLVGSGSPLHIPISQTDKSNNSNPFEFETPRMGNSGDYKNGSMFQSSSPTKKPSPSSLKSSKTSDPQTNFGVHSPKYTKTSPARKLQQVFQNERRQIESEARMLEIVGHLEDELNNSTDPFVLDVVTAKLQSIQQSWKEAEERAARLSHFPPGISDHSPAINPKTFVNARGIQYLEGDPNMGYSEVDSKPRRPQNFPQQFPDKSRLNPNTTKTKPKNWASLLQSQSPSMDMKLDFYPDLFHGKQAQVEIDVELTDVGKWNRYLVGHFLDGKMAYPLVVSTARYQWKELFVAVKPDVAGYYLFEFRDEQAK
ncbi:hypothetical protein RHGRI_010972 [Rhododendron griersonianum]|uniref:Uncharacterized protein n=1 Tax=Rhododendron griersonianum TaxID=479676 RepID=A0AAV6KLF3_9ERIC|nr:hypothetical protein RHGRI_010972 [Rhododendron griersonianum]